MSPPVLLYARTVRHLRPAQVGHRLRLRAQRALLGRFATVGALLLTDDGPVRPGGWPACFHPSDARVPARWPAAAELAEGRVTLLGATWSLGEPADWRQLEAPQLWRYHLHYWDWSWSLALHPHRTWAQAVFARLYRSWQAATVFGHGDAWSPYVVSLRAWTFCGVFDRLVRGTPLQAAFVEDLRRHAGFLRRHLEWDVGGNHLLKNLKALVGLAAFAGDQRQLARRLGQLQEQLDVQVLGDGGHFERSPAYHCQVLADVCDVVELLRAGGAAVTPPLLSAQTRMRQWLAQVRLPDGGVPMLNDGFPLPPEVVDDLLGDMPVPDGSELLADTGLGVLRAGPWLLLADVGPPCPDGLPAHAHADTLSFLLWYDSRPVLVDTGTSTYAPGALRSYERSTAAHNTVVVDGADSTEVWGAFRAARRARVRVTSARLRPSSGRLCAEHDGFARLPGGPVHERQWLLDENRLRIVDRVRGQGRHRVEVLFHLAPGLSAHADGSRLHVDGPGVALVLCARGTGRWQVRPAAVATDWERRAPARVAAYVVDAELPVALSADIVPNGEGAR